MNAEAQSRGLPAILKSLNCDRGYGLGLLAACALLALLESGGDPLRLALRYDRDALALGEWWRAITAHFVHLDAEHTLLNTLGVVLMWALFARDYTLPRWAAIYLASALAIVTGATGKIARDISLLAQTEVAEAFEPKTAGRGGSSSSRRPRRPAASWRPTARCRRRPSGWPSRSTSATAATATSRSC